MGWTREEAEAEAWQCPECGRVKRDPFVCLGSSDAGHAPAKATAVSGQLREALEIDEPVA